MKFAIDHFNINVLDLERSLVFYNEQGLCILEIFKKPGLVKEVFGKL